jgi:hypothetical protein
VWPKILEIWELITGRKQHKIGKDGGDFKRKPRPNKSCSATDDGTASIIRMMNSDEPEISHSETSVLLYCFKVDICTVAMDKQHIRKKIVTYFYDLMSCKQWCCHYNTRKSTE